MNTYMVIPADKDSPDGNGADWQLVVHAVCPESAISITLRYWNVWMDISPYAIEPIPKRPHTDNLGDFWRCFRFPPLDGVNCAVPWESFEETFWTVTEKKA